jgi:hypothetical protein
MPMQGSYSFSRPQSPRASGNLQRRRSTSPDVGHGSVLPSIEDSNGLYSPHQSRLKQIDHTRAWPTPPSNLFARHDPPIIDLTSSHESLRQQRTEERIENPFQARTDRRLFSETASSYLQPSPRPYGQRQDAETERLRAVTGESFLRDPVTTRREPIYEKIYDVQQPRVKHILIPDDEPHSQRIPIETYQRSNPFDARPVSHLRLLEPIPTPSADFGRPPSPRRALEPFPQRYEFPSDSRMGPTDRRVVYTVSSSSHPPDRR